VKSGTGLLGRRLPDEGCEAVRGRQLRRPYRSGFRCSSTRSP
jgi:hypothetical protein